MRATPIPEGGGVWNLQRVFTNDCRIVAPIISEAHSYYCSEVMRDKKFFWKMREVVPLLRSYHILSGARLEQRLCWLAACAVGLPGEVRGRMFYRPRSG